MNTWKDSEEGSSLILVIFAVFLSLALVFAVVSATSLYLERKRLLNLADATSLAATESFDIASTSYSNGKVHVHLTAAEVADAAHKFLVSSGNQSHGVRIAIATTHDGKSATVLLKTKWNPPLLSVFFPAGIEISVSSTSRSTFY